MKIYDISQKIFGCNVYPGDQNPQYNIIKSIKEGDLYNLSSFSMCSHNGTHVDAPSHFIKCGKNIDEISLNHFVGKCYVAEHKGLLSKDDANKIVNKALSYDEETAKRILIKGEAVITLEAAAIFADNNILLIGNESQTVGPVDSPLEVHLKLLEKEIVLLEGICLNEINEGQYFLNSAPINLNGLEGAPTRAILVDFKN